MEANEQIEQFKNFIEGYYTKEISQAITTGKNVLYIDFFKLAKFNPELSEDLLENPDEVLKAAELACEDDDKKVTIRITDLPKTQNVMIKDIRSEHINKLITVEGMVRQKSKVRPKATSAKFECPSCGNVIIILQLEKKFKEPTRCGCGRKGKFAPLSKKMVDFQGITLEEAAEDLEGGEQPQRIKIFLTNDLVTPLHELRVAPGNKVRIVGILKEVQMEGRDGSKLTTFDLLIDVNSVMSIVEDFASVVISAEEKEDILKISKDPNLEHNLIQSVAPSIFGYKEIKKAVLIQLAGGIRKTKEDGSVTRGDIHILLVGDPGAGKSQLLKRVSKIAPKGRYVSGKGASGVGLTAAVVKDEFIGGFALEAGTLVLSNKGLCCIDELDKMSNDDRDAMHEALEQQTVSINKANIQATMRAETTVLAAANPKLGRFDAYEILATQINLPPTLINRFDLIFIVQDLPDENNDEALSSFILKLHKSKKVDCPIPSDLLRKYLAYAKQNFTPQLTDEAMCEIQKYYLKMRKTGQGESGNQPIPISARQLEALIRMSEANARLHLRKKVLKEDALQAVDLMHYCLNKIGLDPETGQIDIDRISSSVTASKRQKITSIKEIVSLEKDGIPFEDIVKKSEEKGITEGEVEESLNTLKRSGDIFEPRRGMFKKV